MQDNFVIRINEYAGDVRQRNVVQTPFSKRRGSLQSCIVIK